MKKRHVAGSGMGYLVLSDELEEKGLTLLEKVVLAYDNTNETPETSDASCAEFLGVPVTSVAEARDTLARLGYKVEDHRDSDLTEDEYYV